MGYTHYWERPNKPVHDNQWNAFIADVKKVFTKHADIICREYDTPDRQPVADDTEVRFNGKGGGGHETCHIQRDYDQVAWRTDDEPRFAFCKTARKPYDEVVVAVLALLRHHCEIFSLSTDGDDDTFPDYEDLVRVYNLEPQKATA